MNKLFYAVTLSLLLYGCKREQVLKTPENGEILEFPSHCYNGVKDGDETGIDCGGACDSCPVIPAPVPTCTHPANTLTVLGSTYTSTVGIATTGTPYTVNGNYSSSNTQYILKLKDVPNLTTNYLLGPYSPTADNEVQFIFYYGFTPITLSNGKVFITKSGNLYSVTICDGVATVGSSTVDVAGCITFQ